MYQGQRQRWIVDYDEHDCPIWKDEEGGVIHTSPPESAFIAVDEEET